jgi:hypothetical protein
VGSGSVELWIRQEPKRVFERVVSSPANDPWDASCDSDKLASAILRLNPGAPATNLDGGAFDPIFEFCLQVGARKTNRILNCRSIGFIGRVSLPRIKNQQVV